MVNFVRPVAAILYKSSTRCKKTASKWQCMLKAEKSVRNSAQNSMVTNIPESRENIWINHENRWNQRSPIGRSLRVGSKLFPNSPSKLISELLGLEVSMSSDSAGNIFYKIGKLWILRTINVSIQACEKWRNKMDIQWYFRPRCQVY